MLSDTSMARMTVWCTDGSVMRVSGRARPKASEAMARRKRKGGTCRRQRAPRPSAGRTRSRLA
jgi:hypothetical protein